MRDKECRLCGAIGRTARSHPDHDLSPANRWRTRKRAAGCCVRCGHPRGKSPRKDLCVRCRGADLAAKRAAERRRNRRGKIAGPVTDFLQWRRA